MFKLSIIFLFMPYTLVNHLREKPAFYITLESHGYGINSITMHSGRDFSLRLEGETQSYLKNRDFFYAYGNNGFVAINLHNGDTEIVLKKDLREDEKEYFKSEIIDAKDKTTSKIEIVEEQELDTKTQNIMKVLENEVTNFPQLERIPLGIPQK